MSYIPGMPGGRVFLSSCFFHGDRTRLSVRDRIASRFNGPADRPVWMGEDFLPLGGDPGRTSIDLALFCVDGVRSCDEYVAVVIDRHGSGIGVLPGTDATTSFFELELFAAALYGKPSHVFVLEGHEPRGRMRLLLDLLGPLLPGFERRPLSADEILFRIDAIVGATGTGPSGGTFRAISREISAALVAERHAEYRPGEALPAVRFLDGLFSTTPRASDLSVVPALFHEIAERTSHQEKLALLWIVLGELSGRSPVSGASEEVLAHWDSALSQWSGSAAWFGLHGFCQLGCLGAISDRARLCERLGPPFRVDHGAFASEYYSIANQLGVGRQRSDLYSLALGHIDLAISADPVPGDYSVRASIRHRVGDLDASVEDHAVSLRMRREAGADDASVGEAESELGFALLGVAGRAAEGIGLMERGVERLSSGPANGFTVRAKRKLAEGYRAAGELGRARDQLGEAAAMARDIGAYYQVDQIVEAAAGISQSADGG